MLDTWTIIDTITNQLKENAKRLTIPCAVLQYGSSVYLDRNGSRQPRDLDLCLVVESPKFFSDSTIILLLEQLNVPMSESFPRQIDLNHLKSGQIQQYGYSFTYQGMKVTLKLCDSRILEYIDPFSKKQRVYRRRMSSKVDLHMMEVRTLNGKKYLLDPQFESTEDTIDLYTPGKFSIMQEETVPFISETFLLSKILADAISLENNIDAMRQKLFSIVKSNIESYKALYTRDALISLETVTQFVG